MSDSKIEAPSNRTRKNFTRSYTSVTRHTQKKRKAGKPIIVTTGYTDNRTGRRLNRNTQKRLESFYIPPAYNNNDILIAKSPNNRVQVICEDTAGRRQYIYHPKYLAGKERRKYNKLSALAKYAHRIERDTRALITRLASRKRGITHDATMLDKDTLTQIVLYMLITYHFRIGCREYEKEYGSTGISTLRPKHIRISTTSSNGHTVAKFRFKGKKGVINHGEETWEPAVKVIQMLCKQHLPAVHAAIRGEPGIDSIPNHLFSYVYTNPISDRKGVSIVTSQDVACYLVSRYGKDALISPKMFRTWYANYHLLDFLRTKPPADTSIKISQWIAKQTTSDSHTASSSVTTTAPQSISDKQRTAWLKREIPKYVSQHLNNTPSVCKSDYINNRLLQDVLRRPEYYRRRALAATTDASRHKLVAQVLAGN